MTDVVAPTTLRGVPKPKPSTKRSFRIPDDLWAQAVPAADFREVYLSEVVRAALENLVGDAKSDPGYAEWLAAREQEKP